MKCGRPGMTAVCYYALDGTTSTAGIPCSKCEGEWKQCNNGLCSHRRILPQVNGQGGNSRSNQSNGNHQTFAWASLSESCSVNAFELCVKTFL